MLATVNFLTQLNLHQYQNKTSTGGPLDMRIQVMRILLMRLFKRFSKNSAYAILKGKYSTYAEFII